MRKLLSMIPSSLPSSNSADKDPEIPAGGSNTLDEMQISDPMPKNDNLHSQEKMGPATHGDHSLEPAEGDPQQETKDVNMEKHIRFMEASIKDLEADLGNSRGKYKELRRDMDVLSQKHSGIKGKYHDTTRKYHEITGKHKDSQKQCDQLQKRYEQLKRDFNKVQKTATERESEVTNLKKNEASLKSHLALVEKKAEERELQIAELQQEAEKQRLHITELTETISRSSQPSTITRDDDYFSGELARLSGAIRQLVLRYFDLRGAPKFSHQELPVTISQSLQRTISGYSPLPGSVITIGRKEIEAVIAHRLSALIFSTNFVFRICEFSFPRHESFRGVSDFEMRKWYAQTTDMLTKHKNFEALFSQATRGVVEDLQNCFPSLAKAGTEETRDKALSTIVEQAARLHIEVCRQLSYFKFAQIDPGAPYSPEFMDDWSGTVDSNDDEEEEEAEAEAEAGKDGQKRVSNGMERGGLQKRREFTVSVLLFPPVARWDFDEAGNFQQPAIVVRKGVVIAVPREADSTVGTK